MEKQIYVFIEVLICSKAVFLVEVLLKIYLCVSGSRTGAGSRVLGLTVL